MEVVNRACFNCKFNSDTPICIQPDKPELAHLRSDNEYVTTDDPCELCGAAKSLRQP